MKQKFDETIQNNYYDIIAKIIDSEIKGTIEDKGNNQKLKKRKIIVLCSHIKEIMLQALNHYYTHQIT